MTLVIAWRTTKLIEDGHRGLQAYRPICYYFTFFTFFTFFSKSKKHDFLRFLPCFIRFLELWWCTVAYSRHHWRLKSWLDQLLRCSSSRMRHLDWVGRALPMITLLTTARSRRCNAVTSATNFCGACFGKAIVVTVSWLCFLDLIFAFTACCRSGRPSCQYKILLWWSPQDFLWRHLGDTYLTHGGTEY